MSQFDELPEGWEEVRIEEIAQKVGSGATPRGGSKAYKQSGIPLIRSMNVHFDGLHEEGIVYLDDHQADGLKNVEVKANDVLLNITGASIGRVTQAPEKMEGARVNQHVCIIRPTENFDPAFLTKYLTSPKVQRVITAEEYGMTRQALTKQMILDFEIPLPPLNEQRRIVEKVEALTARSRRAREALAAIPELLDQFRQSVLAAAFRGDLTADWRAQNPDVEPAEVLLERIRVERRKRWEEAEIEKSSAKHSELFRNKSRNYPEAVGLKYLISDLPDLPSKWIWTTLDELTYFTVDYRGRTPPKVEKGIPLISAAAIKHDKITVGISGYVTSEVYKQWITRGLPEPGDLVITTEAPVGESAIFPGDQTYLLSRRVFACKTNGVSNRYLMHILYSEVSRKHIRNHNRGSTVPRILKPDLLALPIPLPPLEEQKLIVEKIDAALTAKVNILEATKQDLGKDLSQLDRAILAKAFRGELVPQDPTDEPAAVLLERIRAERDKLNPQRQGKKTPARRKKASP